MSKIINSEYNQTYNTTPFCYYVSELLRDIFFCSIIFYVWLLDYSILLKARYDELIHKPISLYDHELYLR